MIRFYIGLRLTLFLAVEEYIGMFSQNVGARIAVHPADETPFPEDRGVSAPPGQMTSVGIKLVCINKLIMPETPSVSKQLVKLKFHRIYEVSSEDFSRISVHFTARDNSQTITVSLQLH